MADAEERADREQERSEQGGASNGDFDILLDELLDEYASLLEAMADADP